MLSKLFRLYFDANAGGGGAGGGAGGDAGSGDAGSGGDAGDAGSAGGAGSGPVDLDTWLATQPAEVQAQVKPLVAARLQALEHTVSAVRGERDNFSRDLRAMAKKAEKGSELEKQLTTLSDKADAANRRADFMEQAPGKECRNPGAAWAVAQSKELFNSKGEPDWRAIREVAPELFAKVPGPRLNGGSGGGPAGGGGSGKGGNAGVNDWIRSQAGVDK